MTLTPKGVFIPPTSGPVHADTRGRVAALEQDPGPGPKDRWFCLTAVTYFSYALACSTGLWRPFQGGINIRRLTLDLGRDTSIYDATVTLYRNDDAIDSIAVQSGDQYNYKDCNWWITPSQSIHFALDSSGGNLDIFERLVLEAWCLGQGGGGLAFNQGINAT